MYYVWKSDLNLVDRFSYFKDDPVGLDMDLLRSGEKITSNLPICDFVTDKSYPTDLSDLLLTGYELHVISPRLVQVFYSLSMENVQYFPTRIKNHETGEIIDNYKILNVIGSINCLDLEHSEFARSRRSGNLTELARYKIIEENVLSYSGEEPPLVFRLGKFEWHLLVGERFKEACESEGITGCEFTSTEEFV